MAKSKSAEKSPIYRLRITLRDTKPPIWRRIEVPGTTRLDHLHLMIQAAMGWYNCHLHSFTIAEETYGMYDDELDVDYEDEQEYRLQDVVPHGNIKFTYTYDFGDNWEHAVLVEKVMPPEAGVKYPRCTDGARACPPEDVGSTCGYAEFLKAIRNPKHEEHEAFLEWVGGKFDSEAFDVKEADAAVKDFKSMQAEVM
jgi:hypothetical protein